MKLYAHRVRTLKFLVDVAHASRVNETLGDLKRLRVAAAIFAVVLAAAAVALAFTGTVWLIVLAMVLVAGAVGSAYLVLWIPRKFGDLQSMYDTNPLVPAVVTAVRPRGMTILALANLAKGEPPQYALVTRRVMMLPGHERLVGERVPCVAVLADRTSGSKSDRWQVVRPMPIAWGAREESVLREGIDKIPYPEWNLLSESIGRSEAVERTREGYVLLRAEELPPTLRGG